MSLGRHAGDLDGNRYFFKEGGGRGYHCEMRIYPDRETGTVIIVNETSAACVKTRDAADREFLM